MADLWGCWTGENTQNNGHTSSSSNPMYINQSVCCVCSTNSAGSVLDQEGGRGCERERWRQREDDYVSVLFFYIESLLDPTEVVGITIHGW